MRDQSAQSLLLRAALLWLLRGNEDEARAALRWAMLPSTFTVSWVRGNDA